MISPDQPPDPPASSAAALLDFSWWFISAALLLTTLGLAAKAIADRNSGREPDDLIPALITSALATVVAIATAVILSNSFESAVLGVLSVVWSLCTAIAPYLAVVAALAVLPFFLSTLSPATPAPPKVSLVKAPRPFDLATELGKAGRLLPVDEHQWWVSVQAPVLLAASVAAIYTDDAR